MELWFLYAVGAAVFAGATAILSKIGLNGVDSHLATAIRTIAVLAFTWLIVIVYGSGYTIRYIDGRTWVLMILSGLCAGGSWLCYFRALKFGDVNKVVPISKNSTILTMLIAFVFLGEPVRLITAVGIFLMLVGAWLMMEKAKKPTADRPSGKSWMFFAIMAAVFASLTAIFGRMGVTEMNAQLWTAIRTAVIVPMSWMMVFIAGTQTGIKAISRKNWIFLILSGMATGMSWLFFYGALQIGYASHVVPIDRLSILFTMAFARIFLGERFTVRSLIGLALLTTGILTPVLI